MKKIVTLISIYSLFLIPYSFAQGPYGNEWIIPSQKYYKVKVSQTGLYRITTAQLAAAGVLSSPAFSDPRKIQIFFNGQEQYIYVYDSAGNNLWDAPDYIEFFGQRNDGSLDSKMYTAPPVMPNPYYSLFTDSASYYITANGSFHSTRRGNFLLRI